jgi:hypothetical protein
MSLADAESKLAELILRREELQTYLAGVRRSASGKPHSFHRRLAKLNVEVAAAEAEVARLNASPAPVEIMKEII